MIEYILVPKQTVQEICNAIRERKNSLEKIKISDISTHIHEIANTGNNASSDSVTIVNGVVYFKSSSNSSLLLSKYNGVVYLNPDSDGSIDYVRVQQSENSVSLIGVHEEDVEENE